MRERRCEGNGEMTILEKKQIHERIEIQNWCRWEETNASDQTPFRCLVPSDGCVASASQSSVPKWYIRALLLWFGNSEVGFFQSHLYVPANHGDLEF